MERTKDRYRTDSHAHICKILSLQSAAASPSQPLVVCKRPRLLAVLSAAFSVATCPGIAALLPYRSSRRSCFRGLLVCVN